MTGKINRTPNAYDLVEYVRGATYFTIRSRDSRYADIGRLYCMRRANVKENRSFVSHEQVDHTSIVMQIMVGSHDIT